MSVFMLAYYISGFDLYKEFESPDGRYVLKVYRYSGYFGFPGSSGDAPGVVLLRDKENDKSVFWGRVNMVQSADEVSWHTDSVKINRVDGIYFTGESFGDWGK